MAITSALVLLAVIWFMTLFIVLPIRLETQGDRGEVVPGTPAGAPAHISMRAKFRLTTLISVPLWVIACAVILSGAISLPSIDRFNTAPAPVLGQG